MNLKLLFTGAASLAALTVSCTYLMPVAQSKLSYKPNLGLGNAVVSAFAAPLLDHDVQADIMDLQASALLDCISADASNKHMRQPANDLAKASRYGALYERLHSHPDVQRALAVMQSAEISCSNGTSQRVGQLQRAAFALDRQVDAALGVQTRLADGEALVGGD